jgi:hypothetical protein
VTASESDDRRHAEGEGDEAARLGGNRGDSVRNSVRDSRVENLIQAGTVNGGVHVNFPSPPNADVTVSWTDSGDAAEKEPSEGQPSRAQDEDPGYLERIVRQRSPVLIWSVLALTGNVAVVGFLEYLIGARARGDSPFADLELGQAGLFFSVFPAVILLWRDVARRHGSDKWKSLREVHPNLVLLFSSRVLLWGLVLVLLALAATRIPDLFDPDSPMPRSPSSAGREPISEWGNSLLVILFALESASFLVLSRSRELGCHVPVGAEELRRLPGMPSSSSWKRTHEQD